MAAPLIVPFEKKHGFNRQVTIAVLKPLLQDVPMGFTLYFNPVVLQWDVNNELRKFTNCPKKIRQKVHCSIMPLEVPMALWLSKIWLSALD